MGSVVGYPVPDHVVCGMGNAVNIPDSMSYMLKNPPPGYTFVCPIFPVLTFWGKRLSWRDDHDTVVTLGPKHIIIPLCPTGDTCYLYERDGE